MPAKKRSDEWRQLVFQIAGDHPTYGPGRVNDELSRMPEAAAILEEDDDKKLPSERTIGRWQREFRLLDEAAKLPYLTYAWPEAMRRCALPWEASAALFDLGRYRKGRPVTIRRARWFWRMTLACPDAPIVWREEIAAFLAATDLLPEDARRATYETMAATISYAPWQSEEHKQLYAEAIERGDIKQLVLTLTPGTTIDEAANAVDELTSFRLGSPPARGSMRSIFEALAEHGSLAAAFAAQEEAASKKGATQ